MNRVEPYNRVFSIENRQYQGMERSHLYDLREGFYNHTIGDELKLIIEKNLEAANYFPHVEVVRGFSDAKKILDYCHEARSPSELIVIKSEMLMKLRDVIEFDTEDVEWLG